MRGRARVKTLQIGNTDRIGNRFNGQDLHIELRKRGIDSSHCVWIKEWDDPDTWELMRFKGRDRINSLVNRIEDRLSIQCLLHPFSHLIPFSAKFRAADIVHYHLIHTRYFSLTSLPLLTRMKPSVWTVHDPWVATGHCVYPYDCERWKTGCGSCPDLNTYMAVRKDRTAMLWKIKNWLYGLSDIDLIVASKWMLDLVNNSPLMSRFPVHHIPFGIDLAAFAPSDSAKAKKDLGVFPGRNVICLRSTNNEYKGMPYIKDCLRRLDKKHKLTILTFDEVSILDEFIGRHQIIDLGWVGDQETTVKAYNAADVFLMPSLTEGFGMMAVEAMACGKPVLVFDGTSLPDVIDAPNGGIAVPMRDSDALAAALSDLLDHPEKRRRLGRQARAIAVERHDLNLHVSRIIDLYSEVISRRRGDAAAAR